MSFTPTPTPTPYMNRTIISTTPFMMLAQFRSRVESWWQNTPLPAHAPSPRFQRWQRFHEDHWVEIPSSLNTPQETSIRHEWSGSFHLLTWNINADAALPESRVSLLLQVIETISPRPDIMFLQEVSKSALVALLSHPWIQQHWCISDAETTHFQRTRQSFMTLTLVSKSCLTKHPVSLGAVWRMPLPTRFGRDALCCDLLLNPSCDKCSLRVRLINVHLDSLPINPSHRPQQLALVASCLAAVGRGLVAGDFNPVLPEDDGIVDANGLVDAWMSLYPSEPGFTWGVYGDDNAFPPNRLDKVAMLNLTPINMRFLPTSALPSSSSDGTANMHFSDHFGLLCEFGWDERDRIGTES